MSKYKKRGLVRAFIVLIIETAAAFTLAFLAALSKYLGAVPHFILLWILWPLCGAGLSCLATVKGLNNYLAWIFPPLALFAAWVLYWHYVISPGPVFLCALIALIGAAAGDVIKKRSEK